MAHAIKTLLNRQLFKHYGHFRYMCKDLTKQNQLAGHTDFLLQNLRNATNTKSVLEMVSAHNSIMNNKHIIQALRSLFTLQKSGKSDISTSEILRHSDFKKLCRHLKFQAGVIDTNDIIDALKTITYVGVPVDSTIAQVLLQLLRHNVNHLSLSQIIFLDFLLHRFDSCPLVEALKIALPIVFEIHLPTKIDLDNISQLGDFLYFAAKTSVSDDCIERIVTGLLAYNGEFDIKTAKRIVWSLCELKSNDTLAPLMRKALDSLAFHLEDIPYVDLEYILAKLIMRYNRQSEYFHHEVFYDSCANHVIDNDLGFKHAIYMLRKFARIGHVNNYLLDYMATQAYQQPANISEGDPVNIYSIVVSVAMTDYRPKHWDAVRKMIVNAEVLAQERKEIIWLKYGASLCLLDLFKLDVLTKCLNESFLDHMLTKNFLSNVENYLTIWQCIKTHKPEMNSLLPSKFRPELLVKRLKRPEFLLEPALHKALGGDKYVKTGIYSKQGLQIDHIVVFRKGGYPVAANFPPEVEYIEDLEIAPDNQVVIIQGLNYYYYTLNKRQLKLSTLFALKHLEAMGYYVVPICLDIWTSLPDFERIPYIMRALKERMDSELVVDEYVN